MFSLASVIAVMVLGLASYRTALRGVETLTTALSTTVRRVFGIRRRTSDTTLSEALANVGTNALHGCLVRLNVAEHRRGNLRPMADRPSSVFTLPITCPPDPPPAP